MKEPVDHRHLYQQPFDPVYNASLRLFTFASWRKHAISVTTVIENTRSLAARAQGLNGELEVANPRPRALNALAEVA